MTEQANTTRRCSKAGVANEQVRRRCAGRIRVHDREGRGKEEGQGRRPRRIGLGTYHVELEASPAVVATTDTAGWSGTDRDKRSAVDRNLCKQIGSSVVSQRGERQAYQRESEHVSAHDPSLRGQVPCTCVRCWAANISTKTHCAVCLSAGPNGIVQRFAQCRLTPVIAMMGRDGWLDGFSQGDLKWREHGRARLRSLRPAPRCLGPDDPRWCVGGGARREGPGLSCPR